MSDGEIRCEGVVKSYNTGQPNEFQALRGVDLTISEGEYASIVGPSGSGKSTLLNLISCLDTPTEGNVYIEDVDINTLNEFEKARLRREKMGFIFQQFNLIRTMSCFENIELPMRLDGMGGREREKRVEELMNLVGLEEKGKNKPTELSGGEQQRVAIARALANNPKIILADEPTGNLDQETGKKIMNLLFQLNKQENKTLIVVTHDPRISKQTPRQIRIIDGKIK